MFVLVLDQLNLKDMAVRNPSFTLDGQTLVWLQRKAGGAHASCLSLVKTRVPLEVNVSELHL